MPNIWGNSDRLYLFGLQNCCRWWMNWAETFHLTICSIICYSFFPLLYLGSVQFSSVQFSYSVMSNFLWLHGLQHTRPTCPSSTLRIYSNSSPLSPVMPSNHLISDVPFSSLLKSFPASGSFQISQFFPSGGQSIGVSASASVLPLNIQEWFPLE